MRALIIGAAVLAIIALAVTIGIAAQIRAGRIVPRSSTRRRHEHWSTQPAIQPSPRWRVRPEPSHERLPGDARP